MINFQMVISPRKVSLLSEGMLLAVAIESNSKYEVSLLGVIGKFVQNPVCRLDSKLGAFLFLRDFAIVLANNLAQDYRMATLTED